MATKHAQILDEPQYQMVRQYVHKYSPVAERDLLFLSLSFRGGLRACEIAGLEIRALVDPQGYLRDFIDILSHATKFGRERMIPMHPEIADAFRPFRYRYPHTEWVAVSPRGGGQMSANAVTLWFLKLFREVRLKQCSSHSGRRTAITNLARHYHHHGGSLVDVQRFAGHSRLETTEAYIEPSNSLTAMVKALGTEPPKQRNPYLGV
jgi:integrase/recombinase XerD